MSSANQNLSTVAQSGAMQNIRGKRVGIVVADWNAEVTGALLQGALETLLRAGAVESDITVLRVPGAFELPFGAQSLLERKGKKAVDGVVVLGCVIRGGTPHFEYVCMGATKGVMDVQLKYNRPVTFGLLTVDDMHQAQDRCGGQYGNKGDEAASTLVPLLFL